jgi:hypothetical protein
VQCPIRSIKKTRGFVATRLTPFPIAHYSQLSATYEQNSSTDAEIIRERSRTVF